MKTFRKLQLRQGQELSRAEQQHVVAGEWVQTGFQKGACNCSIPNHHSHIDILEGYITGVDWNKVGKGALYIFGYGGQIGLGYIAGNGIGALVAGIAGAPMLNDGINEIAGSFNVPLDYRATMLLKNSSTFRHEQTKIEPILP